MAVIANSFLHLPPFLSHTPLFNRKHLSKSPPLRSRLEDDNGMEFSQYAQISGSQSEVRSTDIWKLFTEAQQNIINLNEQRLMVVEELIKAKAEIQTLSGRIENLETQNRGGAVIVESSKLWELLLRIDSMVLTGSIDKNDASDLRKLVLDHKVRSPDIFVPLLRKTDAELLVELRRLSEQTRRSGFHIVHICTEMDPVATVGSLGAYVTGLSRALQKKGNLVEVILPKYKSLDLAEVLGVQEVQTEFYSYFNGQLHGNKIWTGVIYGIGVTFIQPVHFSSFFNREMIYGYPDDFERFLYFSRASLDYLVKSGKHPDVIHIHNWETAIVAPLFWDIFANQGLSATRILLTCQSFGSQCLEQPEKLRLCGLEPSRLNRQDRLQDSTETHLVNPLKGGVVYSNKVVVMSSIYSKGRIIQSLAHGLEPTLSSHRDKLVVAPHGFEVSTWDPSSDQLLPANYSVRDMKGKAICKGALQQHSGFCEDDSYILVGCILSEISEVDLENLIGVLRLPPRGIQFLFIGVSKNLAITSALLSLQEELTDENVRFINEYDEALSHLIFGGADIMLCHSYEDSVLQVPLKAIRYGAGPILISATERRFWHSLEQDFGSTQFSKCVSTFCNMSPKQAVDEIRNTPSQWNQKIKEAMSKDCSWDSECYNVHISAYESIRNV